MTSYKEIKPILQRAAQQNFWAFCCYMDWDFFHEKRRYFKDIAIELQYVVDQYRIGKAVQISISLPPRAGKSYITSLFACYWLAQFPELSVMRNTCTSTLYDKFSYDTRALIRSKKFSEVYPNVVLANDKQNLGGWNLSTSKQVGYFGAGVGGTIIGFGANIAITDDLYKSMQDALSDTVRDKVKMWKESAHDSRKEKNCPEIFIGTRWVKDDVIGEAMSSGKLHRSIVIPALIDDMSFCEDVKSTEEYLTIKKSIEESTWSAEYMQEPLDVKGLLLPLSSLKLADTSIINYDNAIWRLAVGDPADRGGDKYAVPFIYVCVMNGEMICVVKDVICNKDGVEVNSERIKEKCGKLMIEEVYIESNGVGLAAVLQLKRILTSNTSLRAFPSTEEKEVRILSNYEFIRDYFVFDENYKSKEEYNTFMNDLTGYMKDGDNNHKKDAIDVLSTAAKLIKVKFAKYLYS